jgi:hypothetical protein
MLDKAFADAKTATGHFPVLAGDLNVDVGAHIAEKLPQGASLPACVTGPRVVDRRASPNCADLFAWASKYDYVIANTFGHAPSKASAQREEKSIDGFTWFHPRTGRGHIKDLILVSRDSLKSLSRVWVDHEAVLGNNDHSLVVMGLRALKQPRWRRRALLNYTRCGKLQGLKMGRRALSLGRGRNGTGALEGTIPRPGKRTTALEFRHVDNTRARALRDELKRVLNANDGDTQTRGWNDTVGKFKRACASTLSEKKEQEDLPHSWIEIQGCKIGPLWDRAAKYRKKLPRSPNNIALKAELVHTRLRAKQEKQRCIRVWTRTLADVLEKDTHAGRKREAKALLGGRFTSAKSCEGPSPDDFVNHFTKLFGKESDKQTLELDQVPSLRGKKAPPNLNFSGPPSKTEVSHAIKNLSSGKAAGADGLPAEFYKLGAEVVMEQLVKEFECLWPRQVLETGGSENRSQPSKAVPKAWQDAKCVTLFKKGPRKDPGNYRGIFLLDVAGKVLTSVIADRVSKIAEPWLRDEQCGFRKRRGTTQQIFALRRLQEEALRASKPLCAVFIDFKKAFDSPPRSAIWESLRFIGVPEDVVVMCSAIHEAPEGSVTGGTGGNNRFPIGRGVRQGCTLGPILFNILLEFCLRKANIGGIGIQLRCVDKSNLTCPADLRNHSFSLAKEATRMTCTLCAKARRA